MTWVRELRIAEESLRVVVHGLSPETETILARKYAPFITTHPKDQSFTTLTLNRIAGGPFAAEELPLSGAAGVVTIQARGVQARWDLAKRELLGDFVNDLPHAIENAIRFVITRRLLEHGGGCFHAAAVKHAKAAFVVMGESEAGKTTLSQIFGRANTLSDEMPALLPDGEAWRVFSTPFWGDMVWGEAQGNLPLGKIFMLRGKGELKITRMPPNEAQQALLARLFNYSSEGAMAQASLQLCTALAQTPVFALAYPKDIELATLTTALQDAQ